MGHFFSKYLFFCFFHQKNISIFLEAKTKELNAILYISINSPLTINAKFANLFMKKWSLNIFWKKKFFSKIFFSIFYCFMKIFWMPITLMSMRYQIYFIWKKIIIYRMSLYRLGRLGRGKETSYKNFTKFVRLFWNEWPLGIEMDIW